MPRKPVIKAYNSGTWTHARFFGFLRSGLRRMSLRWGPKNEALRAARKPYTGSNKRRRWLYQCSQCKEWRPGKDVAVHHIEACGELRGWHDLEGFARRLFCEVEGFECLCDVCHSKKHKEKR